jgi:hypothetical protein
MFIKAFGPHHFNTNSDEPIGQILKIGSTGLDKEQIKRASAIEALLDGYTPHSGKTAIHTIAMTSSDHFGFNRNGDGWKEANLRRDHPTFVSDAKVYRHHNNKPSSPSFGVVKASAYNEDMHRVELLMELDNEKCAEELALLEKDGSYPVSMACRVPHDVCSICGNKAKHRGEYCKHASHEMGQIYDDGRMVGVDNPSSTFFDISRVVRPADRVAWTLNKVASGEVQGGAILAEELGYTLPFELLLESLPKTASERAQIIQKLSEMEKRVPAKVKPLSCRAIDCEVEEQVEKAAKYSNSLQFDSVMRAFTDRNIMLNPSEFVHLVTGNPVAEKTAQDVRACLPGIYTQLINSDEEEIWKESMYEPAEMAVTGRIAEIADNLMAKRALSLDVLRDQMMSVATTAPVEFVKAAAVSSINTSAMAAGQLAREYVRYQLETLRQIEKNSSADEFDRILNLVVSENYVL